MPDLTDLMLLLLALSSAPADMPAVEIERIAAAVDMSGGDFPAKLTGEPVERPRRLVIRAIREVK